MARPHLLFAVPTLNRYDLLNNLLTSMLRNEVMPDHLMIIDNGLKGNEIYPEPAFHIPTTIVKPGRNIGCAAAWNRALYAAKQLLVLSNDDVEIFPDTLSRLVDAAEANPHENLFIPEPGAGCAFTFCMMRK